jgi:hypothetical protein
MAAWLAASSRGEFHDQAVANCIVIRAPLMGHYDTPCGRPAGLSAARGLAALRSYLVFLVTINS